MSMRRSIGYGAYGQIDDAVSASISSRWPSTIARQTCKMCMRLTCSPGTKPAPAPAGSGVCYCPKTCIPMTPYEICLAKANVKFSDEFRELEATLQQKKIPAEDSRRKDFELRKKTFIKSCVDSKFTIEYEWTPAETGGHPCLGQGPKEKCGPQPKGILSPLMYWQCCPKKIDRKKISTPATAGSRAKKLFTLDIKNLVLIMGSLAILAAVLSSKERSD